MRVILPDTRTRLALDELTGLRFSGAPASVTVKRADLSSDELAPADEKFDLTATRCPDLLSLSWEAGGVNVSAEVEVVSRQLCSVDDVLDYREKEYQFRKLGVTEGRAESERAKAVAVIEGAASRALQPVVSAFVADRPCTGRFQLPALDARRVLSVEDQDGNAVDVSPAVYPGGFVDMTGLDRGVFYVLRVEHGMDPVDDGAREAVASLAAWGIAPRMSPDNATSTSTEAGVLSFVIGGVNGAATSLPDVNAFVSRVGFSKGGVH